MITAFRNKWLDDYYFAGKSSPFVPCDIEAALRRKLDILHAAASEQDLRVPPGNRFEHLKGQLKGWCSVRVNRQFRLIFRWDAGEAIDVYLDPHTYQ